MDNIALQLEGKIDVVKGKLKQKYANLTDDDLMYEEGMDDEFIGRIEQKIGKTKAEIKNEISQLLNK